MASLIVLLFGVSLLAYFAQNSRNGNAKFFLLLIIVAMSLYAGLRTRYNDTYTYMLVYLNKIKPGLSGLSAVQWSFTEHPAFTILEVVIKTLFPNHPQAFLLITAFITNGLFVKFYWKYSDSFSFSMYLYIVGWLFVSSMGGIKQHLAMAIGTLAIPALLERRWAKYTIIIFIASLFHTYVLLYLILPFVSREVWSKNTNILLALSIIGALFFQRTADVLINLTNYIGEEYEVDSLVSTEGMNIYRVLIFSVVPIISFVKRHEINKTCNTVIITSYNASVIAFGFAFIALSGGANVFGRLAYYFLPFTYLALPFTLCKDEDGIEIKNTNVLLLLCIVLYFVFFVINQRNFIYYNVFNYKWY